MRCVANVWRSAGVWLSRYLSTNAATPLAASALATSQPSFSMESTRNPPPGATTTAVPVARAGSGRKGVSVATTTLRAKALPYWECHASGAVAPGSVPVPRVIAVGCAGMGVGTILSFCACAGAASSRSAVTAAAAVLVIRMVVISIPWLFSIGGRQLGSRQRRCARVSRQCLKDCSRSPDRVPRRRFSTLMSSSRSGQWIPSPCPMSRQ